MQDKRVMIKWYSDIASKFNVEYTLVKGVIDSYIDYCQERLGDNHRVSLLGIVDIVPTPEVKNYMVTPAYICKEVADKFGYTYTTTSGIVFEFLDLSKSDILRGVPVTIRGLCTINPLHRQDGTMVVHASISRTLQDKLNSIGISARVHTNKVLKRRVKEGVSS